MGTFRGNADSRYTPSEPRDAAITLGISPQVSRDARAGEYTITISNESDQVETLALFVDSPAHDLQYTFEPSHLRVAARSQAAAHLLVHSWSALEHKAHPFVISVLRSGSSTPVARATAQFVPGATVAREATATGRALPIKPILIGAGLLLLMCATGVMALLAWQVYRSRDVGTVVAHNNPTPNVTVVIPVTGGAKGSAATTTPAPANAPSITPAPAETSVQSSDTPVPPTNTPAPPPQQPGVAAPDAALINYYANINKRAYGATWAGLSPRYQSAANQNNFDAYQNFWNSVAQVTVVNTKLLSQGDSIATVRATLRYAYNDGRVVDEVTTFRMIADASRHQWLIDEVVK